MNKNTENKSDSELSKEAGKERNYLAVVRSTNPAKYDLLKKMGISRYEDECNTLRNQLADLYYEVLDNDELVFVDFYRLYLRDVFKNVFLFHSFINHHAFGGSTFSMPINSFDKIKKTVNYYNVYKEIKLPETA